MKLSEFKVLSFDCYGTLIDWETGLSTALRPLIQRSGSDTAVSDLLEAYGPIEFEVEMMHPDLRYSELLLKVHARLAEYLGTSYDAAEAEDFSRSVGDWPAFPDTIEALRYLKQHFCLVILSNVDRASFAKSNERLGVEFDYVFTAEEIGSYKPSLRNFEFMLGRLGGAGIAKRDLLHVAQSLFHDHAPANQLEIASAWINRRHGKSGSGATSVAEHRPRYDFSFASLAELAAAHQAEQG